MSDMRLRGADEKLLNAWCVRAPISAIGLGNVAL